MLLNHYLHQKYYHKLKKILHFFFNFSGDGEVLVLEPLSASFLRFLLIFFKTHPKHGEQFPWEVSVKKFDNVTAAITLVNVFLKYLLFFSTKTLIKILVI